MEDVYQDETERKEMQKYKKIKREKFDNLWTCNIRTWL